MPGRESPEERIRRLRAEIAWHDQLYFVHATPEISDEAYDRLMRELRDLEAQHPELHSPDSPTQRVGELPVEGFESVAHRLPMLSVDNTYSLTELAEFDARLRKALPEDTAFRYVVEPKIDGVALALRYEGGRLARALTRGDGKKGDDVTANARTLRSIPLQLAGEGWPDVLEVRGEVYWPRPDFERINEQRLADGLEPFKNPRNATSGTLKQLDPKNVAGRGLRFLCHGLGEIEPAVAYDTQSDLFAALRAWGIPTNPLGRICADLDSVNAFVQEWETLRDTVDYDTDGLVIKVDELVLRQQLGNTSKAPRWCIAYKYAAEQAETILRKVDFQVGKLGTITPRANFDPVELAGTTVRRATLHNFDQVARLDLHIGDVITVEKAGEIIPQVVGVDPKQRPKGAEPIRPPKTCPECGGEVAQDEGGVAIRCINPACPAQLVERLKFFVGRDQMDIEMAGEVLIVALVEKGLVKSYADLYRLHERAEELPALPVSVNSRTGSEIKLGEKRAAKLLESLEASKRRPLHRLVAALNIRHIGVNAAELLAEAFPTLDELAAAECEALQEIDGIGPEMAASVFDWFRSEAGRKIIADLQSVGVNPTQPKRQRSASQPLAGKTLVVTGTLTKYSRKEIEGLIKQHGGKASSSVTSKTDYLVAGEKAGSKLAKAEKLGVQVLSEDAFEAILLQKGTGNREQGTG